MKSQSRPGLQLATNEARAVGQVLQAIQRLSLHRDQVSNSDSSPLIVNSDCLTQLLDALDILDLELSPDQIAALAEFGTLE